MAKKLDPRWFPDYENRKVVDGTMERLDLHGIGRRDFLAFASVSAIAAATATTMGFPSVAVADKGGKMAHLMMTLRLEYVANADTGAHGAAEALGMEITSVDGQLDSERQLNQFEQQIAGSDKGALLLVRRSDTTLFIAVQRAESEKKEE